MTNRAGLNQRWPGMNFLLKWTLVSLRKVSLKRKPLVYRRSESHKLILVMLKHQLQSYLNVIRKTVDCFWLKKVFVIVWFQPEYRDLYLSSRLKSAKKVIRKAILVLRSNWIWLDHMILLASVKSAPWSVSAVVRNRPSIMPRIWHWKNYMTPKSLFQKAPVNWVTRDQTRPPRGQRMQVRLRSKHPKSLIQSFQTISKVVQLRSSKRRKGWW